MTLSSGPVQTVTLIGAKEQNRGGWNQRSDRNCRKKPSSMTKVSLEFLQVHFETGQIILTLRGENLLST